MSTDTVLVPAEIATQIDDIFEGLVDVGCQLAMSSDGIRDGIVLHRVSKKDSTVAHRRVTCLVATRPGGLWSDFQRSKAPERARFQQLCC